MATTMIKLTDEMRDLIDNAIANGTPCILATASKVGEPHMTFRGSVLVFDDESLALWDRSKRQSLREMAENPHASILFRHPQKRIIWQFLGEATIHESGPVREQVMARVVQPELDRDPDRKGAAIVVRVNKILLGNGDVLQQRDA
jgi:predicted pyridoxine 5'-phosphate oxidase superfamily flavin-nucleotide-binding protein